VTVPDGSDSSGGEDRVVALGGGFAPADDGDVRVRVIGTAVAGDAALTLGEEAQIETRNLAQLLCDLRPGPDGTAKDRLTKKTSILVDEAGTLGAQQARELFGMAKAAGAKLRLLGDESQHESVGRGAVLRGLVEQFCAFDMGETQRAQSEHLRKACVDLRAGRVSLAFDALRNEGHIAGYADKDEAKAALVRGYVGSIENGRSALLVAPTNVDVDDLNARVHAAVSDRLGEERTYRTAFGKRGFAVGDLVVAREPNRDAAKTVNRDAFTVTGHRDDGRLELRRERDGAAVTWNLLEKPRLDFGYARTSNSSQGRTVDDQFVLPARSRRGAYVDVTRARQNVTIAYGQDEIPDFGRLMAQAQRDNTKTLVRDAVTAQAERKAQQKRAEDVKRGYAAEAIGQFYVGEDEIVRGKDGTEYTIAEGWHTVVGALTLDGKELRDVAVTLTATSDDGTRGFCRVKEFSLETALIREAETLIKQGSHGSSKTRFWRKSP
jgi:ATP-dependent exoDNAse (exonuclease V) alpha subunit